MRDNWSWNGAGEAEVDSATNGFAAVVDFGWDVAAPLLGPWSTTANPTKRTAHRERARLHRTTLSISAKKARITCTLCSGSRGVKAFSTANHHHRSVVRRGTARAC
jgi:hypothetical protein